MTQHKHLKQLVRARMEKTGESYSAARRQTVQQTQHIQQAVLTPVQSRFPQHLPGIVPAAAGLRVLFAHAGLGPLSEPMVFGMAGGIGAGVFAFRYEKEDFSSFYVAGLHLWQDNVAYVKYACERVGLEPVIQESSGGKSAEKQLLAALDAGPVLAWVDMAHLPHRALPQAYSGMGYHLVTVYDADPAAGIAHIGDLADDPIEIPLTALAEARGRIKSQKHRLLSVKGSGRPLDLRQAVNEGVRACHQALTSPKMKNFSLEAFKLWAERMHGSSGKESWDMMFPPGHHLWRGLTSLYDYVEHYGTGGGLMRPMYADFFSEAAEALGDPALRELGERYAELGRGWSDLADAALPSGVPMFREAKELCTARSELTLSGGATEEVRSVWTRLGELGRQARECFPLTAAQAEALRRDLKARIEKLYEGETAALRALGAVAP
ncbi:MAG: hypothetical protein QOF89_1578 [Acidobacteriota bacterium]|jgi:hypothetical protein|nr:hypothetical protein [Acidobacteriota bacterium]